jgi:hypothetical protein
VHKINERLTLVANLSVVVGIVFLGAEMRQNTRAVQAQTRDSMTDKQMRLAEWATGMPELIATFQTVEAVGIEQADATDQMRFFFFVVGNFREWENSYYQYRNGLFSPEEFEPRLVRWRKALANPNWRYEWDASREEFSPSFRAELDLIVAEAVGRPSD